MPAQKPPVYLLDSMAFVFRAYHAMQRSRPMSTRTGIPTAATYVFINMINKLREDFAPQYLAAIYEGGAPVHRNERAAEMKTVQKFNIKTQQFDEIDYGGYKATRAATPDDLKQQQPYIRRALDAFRIPILNFEGYEADDVIGTLSCRLAEQGHHVYIVSSDKDMMQLVNEHVSILNPMKDNLILDPAGVEAALGVAPHKVIDIMALRGDSIDNIPGAPGIGDKGSVELIQQWGSVEAALDHADEIKKKTYRESLQNNRDAVLISKELVTIHCNLPMDYSLEQMQTTAADPAELRALYTELEFTTLLKELPAPETTSVAYLLDPTPQDIEDLLAAARQPLPPTTSEAATNPSAPSFPASSERVGSEAATNYSGSRELLFYNGEQLAGLALFLPEDLQALAEEAAPDDADAEPEEPADAPASNLNLFNTEPTNHESNENNGSNGSNEKNESIERDNPLLIGLAATPERALLLDLHSNEAKPIREALADPTLPKSVHDLKAVLRTLQAAELSLAGVRDDVMLYSYLINPTHLSHTLADVAARFNDRALTGTDRESTKKSKTPPPENPTKLPEYASAVLQLTRTLRPQVLADELEETYRTIDLPLVPVLLRMEQAGCQIDTDLLRAQNSRIVAMMDSLAERIYDMSGHRFNINSPKQLGDVLFNKMDLPKPLKYGKGKVVSTAQDVLEELSVHHEAPRLVLEYRQLAKLRSNYTEQLPLLVDRDSRVHTTFNQVATSTGRLSATNPNLQNIPVRTEIGREIRAAFTARPASSNEPKEEAGAPFFAATSRRVGSEGPTSPTVGSEAATSRRVSSEAPTPPTVESEPGAPFFAATSRRVGSEAATPPTVGSEAATPPTVGSEAATPPTVGSEAATPPTVGSEAATTSKKQASAPNPASATWASEPNILLAADYSQIELRLMAHFSQDPLLLHAYRNNLDIHTLTAAEVFGIPADEIDKETRGRAKAVNFGIVYGISPFGLAANLGIDQKTAKTYIETYFDRYAGVRDFIERTLRETRESGKVSTLFGRTRPIPDIHSRNPNARGFAERTAVNTPLQGTAADMIKVAMLRIDAALRTRHLETQMTLQVHDELLFDAPPHEAEEVTTLVKQEMESVITLTIPIVAEVNRGPNWRDAK